MNIALIDYGAGNVASVERALQRLGATTNRVAQSSELSTASAIVLPGVGHYSAIIRALDERSLRAPLLKALLNGTPFLGICLGLQALYACSEEAPALKGLGLFKTTVQSLPQTVKLPHMGWNRVRFRRASPLLEGLDESAYFYFAHTFAALDLGDAVSATCEHGARFAALLETGRIYAAQFHPEKSGAAGARLLQNFLRLAA